MASIILTKFDKEKRVIELHLEGKTIRELAKDVHMSKYSSFYSIIRR
jgi:hypothetical protein